ncbi:MAG: hypothetical protein LAO20_22485 [Acidobacteriia bacterium]|nr:hypothetical protein [Terriglobia bacterium]
MVAEKKKALVVTVSGDRPIHEVAKDLRTEGFDVKQVLEAIGSITGAAHPKAVNKLRAVRGVADISEDQPVNIGPPDAPVS